MLPETPASETIEAPAVVPEISNAVPALVRLTWLDAAMLPGPAKASVPVEIVVAPV